jgi:hypothetical protein
MFFKYIHIPSLIISFLIGIALMIITNAHKKKVYVYPTPETYSKLLYTDKVGNCYRYKQSILDCPVKKTIFNIPIQS